MDGFVFGIKFEEADFLCDCVRNIDIDVYIFKKVVQ